MAAGKSGDRSPHSKNGADLTRTRDWWIVRIGQTPDRWLPAEDDDDSGNGEGFGFSETRCAEVTGSGLKQGQDEAASLASAGTASS